MIARGISAPARASRHARRTARPRTRWRSPPSLPAARASPTTTIFDQAAPAGATVRPVARRAELQEQAITMHCPAGRQQQKSRSAPGYRRKSDSVTADDGNAAVTGHRRQSHSCRAQRVVVSSVRSALMRCAVLEPTPCALIVLRRLRPSEQAGSRERFGFTLRWIQQQACRCLAMATGGTGEIPMPGVKMLALISENLTTGRSSLPP